MKKYHHILLATNFTDASKKVADRALLLAKKWGSELRLIHIIEYSPLLFGGADVTVPLNNKLEDPVLEIARENLAKEGERLGITLDNQYLEVGPTVESLVALIKDLKTDLVIIGSYEHHGLGFMLGSIADSLLHKMPCDVLAIRI